MAKIKKYQMGGATKPSIDTTKKYPGNVPANLAYDSTKSAPPYAKIAKEFEKKAIPAKKKLGGKVTKAQTGTTTSAQRQSRAASAIERADSLRRKARAAAAISRVAKKGAKVSKAKCGKSMKKK